MAALLLVMAVTACDSTAQQTSAQQASTGPAEAPSASFPVTLELKSIPLDSTQPEDNTLGRLRYLAGFHLTADRSEFGGFSGLECVGDDGLIAVSDRGHWLSLGLGFDDEGRLTSLVDTQMGPLLDEDGQPVAGRERRDAEELTEAPGGGFLVTFEGEHRAAVYGAERGQPLTGRPQPFPSPQEIHQGKDNSGFEAVTRLADGRMMFLAEDFRDREGRLIGWLDDPHGGKAEGPAYGAWHLQPTGPFLPTAADTLPSDGPWPGDILLLQRHYTPETGTRVRLLRLSVAELRVGALLVSEELARFEAPRTVDNFEGLAICPRPDGEPLLYLISDDNFSDTQRTLLLQLELTRPDEAPDSNQRRQ